MLVVPRPRTVSDEDILAAAARVVGEVGPERLTLADVGRRVGLAPATLLQRFGSRRGLLLALATHDVDAVPTRIRAAGEAADSVLDALVTALASVAGAISSPAEFGNRLAFLLTDLSDPEFQAVARRFSERLTAAIAEVLDAAAGREEIGRGEDTAGLAELMFVVYNGALVSWGLTPQGQPADAVRRHLRAVLDGRRAAHAPGRSARAR